MSVARFIADQRTNYLVPHALVCALLGVCQAWFYKWLARANGPGAASGLFTDTDRRRDTVDRAVRIAFKKAKGPARLAPPAQGPARGRVAGQREDRRRVDAPTGPGGPRPTRRSGLTRQDRSAPKFPDLVRRDSTAPAHRTASGSAISPRSPRPRASCTWPPSSTCTPAGCSARRPAPTPTPTWRARRSRWRSPPAAARR